MTQDRYDETFTYPREAIDKRNAETEALRAQVASLTAERDVMEGAAKSFEHFAEGKKEENAVLMRILAYERSRLADAVEALEDVSDRDPFCPLTMEEAVEVAREALKKIRGET